jgi:tripartite-type tricarboxylate transporter receptor subunit TctC
VAPHLAQRLGQPVVVDNKPGAGGNIALEIVAKAPPDGTTIGLGAAGALVVNPSLYPQMPFDPVKDFAPVGQLAAIPFVLIAHPGFEARSVEALVALGKSRPGAVQIGHGGMGTAMHLSAELLKLTAGIDAALVPYKGSAPVATDVLAGHVPLGVTDIPAALPHIRSGGVRALAVTTAGRLAVLPHVPTLAEAGVTGYESAGWFGVVAPAGTPQSLVDRFSAEFTAALARPEVSARIRELGAEPAPSSPAAFAALIRAEIPKWARVIETAGVKLD